jgi:FdhE protein
MSFDILAKLDRMDEISQKKTAYRELMSFYGEIFRERHRCSQTLKLPGLRIDSRILAVKVKEGFPLFDKSAVALDLDALTELFISLLKISRKKNHEAAADIGYFFQQKDIEIRSVIQNVWDGDLEFMRGDRQVLGDPFLLYFLIIESLKPVYTYYAEILEEHHRDSNWGWGYCPVCGELPPISEVAGKEAPKRLFCVYCETVWPFEPYSCPFCGKEEEAGRKRLVVGEEREYSIEVCTECRKYIKAVDVNIIGKRVPLDVENIATIHLDMLAQQEGFERGAPIQLLV